MTRISQEICRQVKLKPYRGENKEASTIFQYENTTHSNNPIRSLALSKYWKDHNPSQYLSSSTFLVPLSVVKNDENAISFNLMWKMDVLIFTPLNYYLFY